MTDLKNMRIYLTQANRTDHDPRSVLLQALGHHVWDIKHRRITLTFCPSVWPQTTFAAALMMPEKSTVDYLRRAKNNRELAIEDLRDAFAVSYESAAHRFTNLTTEHLGMTCHFQKVHESGILHKAYENDRVNFPADHTGAIEGQSICR